MATAEELKLRIEMGVIPAKTMYHQHGWTANARLFIRQGDTITGHEFHHTPPRCLGISVDAVILHERGMPRHPGKLVTFESDGGPSFTPSMRVSMYGWR